MADIEQQIKEVSNILRTFTYTTRRGDRFYFRNADGHGMSIQVQGEAGDCVREYLKKNAVLIMPGHVVTLPLTQPRYYDGTEEGTTVKPD